MTNTVFAYPSGVPGVMVLSTTFLFMFVGTIFALREFRMAEAVASGSRRERIIRAGVPIGVVIWAASLLSTILLQSGADEVSEVVPIVVALVIAVAGCTYACLVTLGTSFRSAPVLGGVAIGFTIAFTQLLAMIGHHPPAPYAWNLDAIMLAVAIAVVFSAIAFRLIARQTFSRSFEIGCAVLAATVVLTHVVALRAV